jgi:hypothetical protein
MFKYFVTTLETSDGCTSATNEWAFDSRAKAEMFFEYLCNDIARDYRKVAVTKSVNEMQDFKLAVELTRCEWDAKFDTSIDGIDPTWGDHVQFDWSDYVKEYF